MPGARHPPKCHGRAAPDAVNGWQTVAPSALPFTPGTNAPMALDTAGIERLRDAFVAAAKRADAIGIDAVQLHGAHGYLLHQFLSPLSNQRDDDYGGSLENRMRLPLEIFDAVRAALPAHKPVTMRVSGTDWVEGGWDIEQTTQLAALLETGGHTVRRMVRENSVGPPQAASTWKWAPNSRARNQWSRSQWAPSQRARPRLCRCRRTD